MGYGEPAPGAGEEDWRGSLLVMRDQGPSRCQSPFIQVMNCKRSQRHKRPAQSCLRTDGPAIAGYPDWESKDVSDKRDVGPQLCAYHDVISSSRACTALALGCLLVYGLVLPGAKVGSQVPPDKGLGSPLHQECTFGLPLVAQAQ